MGFNTVSGQNMAAVTPMRDFLNRWTPNQYKYRCTGLRTRRHRKQSIQQSFCRRWKLYPDEQYHLGVTLRPEISLL